MYESIRSLFARLRGRAAAHDGDGRGTTGDPGPRRPPPGFVVSSGRTAAAVAVLGLAAAGAWALLQHPPVGTVAQAEAGVRLNRWTGAVTTWGEGMVVVVPGLHQLRVLSLRDQLARPREMRSATGPAPLQSLEGLSFGTDLSVRFAIDPRQVVRFSGREPELITAEVVEPAVRAVAYGIFARFTIREIFSTRRAEIQRLLAAQLRPVLAADGLLLRAVQMGQVDLPDDYRRGMEGLLAEELAKEKMAYTLEIKARRVRESELEAEAEKIRRERQAEAAAREQVIAAKAQEDAMAHVLPFKQRQVEQRRLEAEAERQALLKAAEGSAEARRIEAAGEAAARQTLAEAEAWRLDRIGRVNAEQLEREGALVSRHPLLIQKSLADKLADNIQVIIAPPPADGGFIANALVGQGRVTAGDASARDGSQAP